MACYKNHRLCQGETGVQKILEIIKEEFTLTMALAGCRTVDEIGKRKRLVVHESYYKQNLSKL